MCSLVVSILDSPVVDPRSNPDSGSALLMSKQSQAVYYISSCLMLIDHQKRDIMKDILISKFTQHPDLKDLLLKTGTKKLAGGPNGRSLHAAVPAMSL